MGGGGAEHGHGAHGDFRTKVWSMTGGPYCRPKHWKRNTAIAMKSAELEKILKPLHRYDSSFSSTMFTATGRIKLAVAIYTAVFCVVLHSCRAQDELNTIQDCASSCGDIHNIGYPFRLNTDPEHCGDMNHELACKDDAVTLYLPVIWGVVGYRVQAINYNNFTIRLADPNVHMDNCTLSVTNSLRYYDFLSSADYMQRSASSDFTQDLYRSLILISCAYPATGSLNEYNSPCNKLDSSSSSHMKRYWYVKVGDMNSSDLGNWCRIEAITMTSLLPEGARNISYIDVINSFAFGFELAWEPDCCASEGSRKYNCSGFLQYCQIDKQDLNRLAMTDNFGHLFSFFQEIKVTSVFSDILTSLNKTLGGQYVYDRYSDLTIFGLVIHFLVAILAVLVLYKVLLCFLGPICVTIFLIYKWRRRHLSAYDNVEDFLESHQNYLMPVRYSYSEVKKMTKRFKEKLGEGGYGCVYKGKLRSDNFAAIKMLGKSKANGQEFINEVATIGRIHHVNVVKLIGFCVEGSKCALVYEFMPNGSLDKHIFSKEGGVPMSNKKIYDISLGVAHGIEYLHQGCDMQILHFDIKPHNILLDENFIPKISDFGLARLYSTDNSIVSLTAARGTMGYMAPELFYKNIRSISYKADIYSFGMLLMEMVGRRKNINAFTEHSSRIYFPSWIYDQFNEGKDVKLGDKTEEESKIVKKMIIVALWCIQLNPVDRPSMHKVIEMLEREVEHLQMPPKPFVAPQETPTNDAGLNTNSEISPTDASSDNLDTISLLIDVY